MDTELYNYSLYIIVIHYDILNMDTYPHKVELRTQKGKCQELIKKWCEEYTVRDYIITPYAVEFEDPKEATFFELAFNNKDLL